MFFVLSRAWYKEKNSESDKESNPRPSDFALRCSITEPQRLHGERGLLLLSLGGVEISKELSKDVVALTPVAIF